MTQFNSAPDGGRISAWSMTHDNDAVEIFLIQDALPALTPALSRKREREQDHAVRSNGADLSRAERSNGPCGFQLPCRPCREAQGVGRAG